MSEESFDRYNKTKIYLQTAGLHMLHGYEYMIHFSSTTKLDNKICHSHLHAFDLFIIYVCEALIIKHLPYM